MISDDSLRGAILRVNLFDNFSCEGSKFWSRPKFSIHSSFTTFALAAAFVDISSSGFSNSVNLKLSFFSSYFIYKIKY